MIRGRKDDFAGAIDNKDRVLIVADDLTGANDTVVQFSRRGLKCMVITSGNAAKVFDTCDVLAIDTESRFDDNLTAYNKVFKAAGSVRKKNIGLVYKKIDSTMRGNPGAEISALMDSLDIRRAIIAPALPVYGRQTVNGNVYVNKVLLSDTEFSRDPVSPVKQSFIPGIISSQTAKKTGVVNFEHLDRGVDHLVQSIEELFTAGSEMVVVDARTEADLDLIASCHKKLKDNIVYAGCSGLAKSLSRHIGHRDNRISIVLAGSVSEITRRQIGVAVNSLPVVVIDVDTEKIITGKWRSESLRILRDVKEASGSARDVIIHTSPSPGSVENTFRIGAGKGINDLKVCELISGFMGRLAKQILGAVSVRGFLLTGGDTAVKVVKCLGVSRTIIIDEIDEGIPYGSFDDERYRGIIVVSKAGGFGNDDAIARILDFLKGK